MVVDYTVRSGGSSSEKRHLRLLLVLGINHILLLVVVVSVNDLFPKASAFVASLTTLRLSPIQHIETILIQDQTFDVSSESREPLAS